MGLKIVFSNQRGASRKFYFGIQEDLTVLELAKLCKITEAVLLAGDINVILPDKSKIPSLNITSQELKNILTEYANETIYLYPDVEKFSQSKTTLTI
jgi:hypothetical protein